MSRSYYKYAHWKLNNSKYYKRLVHRRNRHAKDIPNGSAYKYSVNVWDICDYKHIFFTYKDFQYFFKYSTIDDLHKIWRK